MQTDTPSTDTTTEHRDASPTAPACCDALTQSTCCAPTDKAGCCGTAAPDAPTTCGCR